MARHDAPNWHDCTKMILLLSLVTLGFVHEVRGQRVKVEPEVLSYPGQTVNLRCTFSDPTGIQLTQVSWIYEPKEGERINIAVFHPNFGANYPESPQKGRVSFTTTPPTLGSPAIQITDVKMTDEGKYVCEYATYPIGNEQGITSLVMLAKPQNSASTVTVVAGEKLSVVARCESADGRPSAQISWVTTAGGNATTKSTAGGDNTVTVTSEYKLVPRAADNGKDISCVVSHRTLTKPESFKMKLAVEFPPQVSISGYDSNWYVGRTNVVLTCQATGNPIPTIVTWKTLTGEIPDTVVIDQNKLTVLKVDEAVNNTFVCEVKNRLGIGKDQVTAVVREPTVKPSNAGVVAGAVIGSLLALLLVAALIAVLVTRSRRQQQNQQQQQGGGYRGGASDLKSRFFGGGKKKTSKNGTGGAGGGGNNNGPIYVYSEGTTADKNNHHSGQPLTAGGMGAGTGVMGPGGAGTVTTPTAQDILLSSELDEAERRKFDELELEDEEAPEERYDHFGGGGGGGGGVGAQQPILQLRPPPHDQEDMMGGYLDDDMESQRDGSVISRTAVYV